MLFVSSRIKLITATCLTIGLLASSASLDDLAWAKKKKKAKGPSPEEIEKQMSEALTPMNDTLTKLLVKLQSRGIFSPDESGKLEESHIKLLSLMKLNPTSELLIEPVYQAGILQMLRGNYDNAYEMFSHLEMNFPGNPYTLRAAHQFKKMKREMVAKGYEADYFPDIPPPAAEGAAPSSDAAKDAKKKP